ncbi:MAG: ABC transporter substrate-binding protein [Nitrospirae bacterium]|nr:ABC transporter substrate-binding protein [Nitrospirota bacterium]
MSKEGSLVPTIRSEVRYVRIVTATVLLVLSVSCSSRDRVDGFIHYRLNHNPTTLDPAMIVDVTGGAIAAKLFNGLVRLDDQYRVIPDIAERWEISADGRIYTFHLKRNVFFYNTHLVTSLDFKYSFKRILTPGGRSPNGWVLDKIAGARDFMDGRAEDIAGLSAPDRYTLRIELEEPFSPFLYLLTMTAAYVVSKEAVEQAGSDFSVNPVGTGPFQLKEWRHNDRVILKRNDTYFGGLPTLAGIVYRIIPEDLTAVTQFELGNLDVLSVPASDYRRFLNSAEWKDLIVSVPGINTYYLGFNCSRPPFDDPLVRRAISQALDRKKILETYYEKRGVLARGPVPDVLRAWSLHATTAYDPAAAAETIRKTGLRDHTINFYITSDQEVTDIAEIIQYFLRLVGLNVSIKQLEWSSYKAALNKGEADMFWISWWADYPDPENFLFPLFHSSNHGASGNRTWYTNPKVDALVEKGQKSQDRAEQNLAYGEAEELIVHDAPWVPFWHKSDVTVRQSTIKNFRAYPIYSMDKGLEVSF